MACVPMIPRGGWQLFSLGSPWSYFLCWRGGNCSCFICATVVPAARAGMFACQPASVAAAPPQTCHLLALFLMSSAGWQLLDGCPSVLGTVSLCQEQQRGRTEAGKGHKGLERSCLPQSSWQAGYRALSYIFLSLSPLGLLLKYLLKYPL